MALASIRRRRRGGDAPPGRVAEINEGASWRFRSTPPQAVKVAQPWWSNVEDLIQSVQLNPATGLSKWYLHAMFNDASRSITSAISEFNAKTGAAIDSALALGYRPLIFLNGDVIWVRKILHGASDAQVDALKVEYQNYSTLCRNRGAWKIIMATANVYPNDTGAAKFIDMFNAWLRTQKGVICDEICDFNANVLLGALGGGHGDDAVRPYTYVSNPGGNPNFYMQHGAENYPFPAPPGSVLPTDSHASNIRGREEAKIAMAAVESASVMGATVFSRAVSHGPLVALWPSFGARTGYIVELEDQVFSGAGGTGSRLNPVDVDGNLLATALVSGVGAAYRQFGVPGADVFSRHVAATNTWGSPQFEHPLPGNNNTLPHQPHRMLLLCVGHTVRVYKNTAGLAVEFEDIAPAAGTSYPFWDGAFGVYRACKQSGLSPNAAVGVQWDLNNQRTVAGGRITVLNDAFRGAAHAQMVAGAQGPLEVSETKTDASGGSIGDVTNVISANFDAAASTLAMAAASANLALSNRLQIDYMIESTAANPGTDQIMHRREYASGEFIELWALTTGKLGYRWSFGGTTSAVVATTHDRTPAGANKTISLSLNFRDVGGGFVQVFMVKHGFGQSGGAFDAIAGAIVGGAGRDIYGGGSVAWKWYFGVQLNYENNPARVLESLNGRAKPVPFY